MKLLNFELVNLSKFRKWFLHNVLHKPVSRIRPVRHDSLTLNLDFSGGVVKSDGEFTVDPHGDKCEAEQCFLGGTTAVHCRFDLLKLK